MNKIPWFEILRYILMGIGSAKGISKITAKSLVVGILKYSGPQGFITSLILEKAIKWGILEGRDIIQDIKDDKTIKVGDYLEAMPANDEIKKKRKENLKKLIEG